MSLPNLYINCSWQLNAHHVVYVLESLFTHTITKIKCNHYAHKTSFNSLTPLLGSQNSYFDTIEGYAYISKNYLSNTTLEYIVMSHKLLRYDQQQ